MKTVIAIIILSVFLAYFVISSENKQEKDNLVEIAKVITAEACGEDTFGMILVANVIKNRSTNWAIPMIEVVKMKNQFYGYTSIHKAVLFEQCGQQSLDIIKRINNLPDFTNGAVYFRQITEPLKPWHKKETFRYKNHIFYK